MRYSRVMQERYGDVEMRTRQNWKISSIDKREVDFVSSVTIHAGQIVLHDRKLGHIYDEQI